MRAKAMRSLPLPALLLLLLLSLSLSLLLSPAARAQTAPPPSSEESSAGPKATDVAVTVKTAFGSTSVFEHVLKSSKEATKFLKRSPAILARLNVGSLQALLAKADLAEAVERLDPEEAKRLQDGLRAVMEENLRAAADDVDRLRPLVKEANDKALVAARRAVGAAPGAKGAGAKLGALQAKQRQANRLGSRLQEAVMRQSLAKSALAEAKSAKRVAVAMKSFQWGAIGIAGVVELSQQMDNGWDPVTSTAAAASHPVSAALLAKLPSSTSATVAQLLAAAVGAGAPFLGEGTGKLHVQAAADVAAQVFPADAIQRGMVGMAKLVSVAAAGSAAERRRRMRRLCEENVSGKNGMVMQGAAMIGEASAHFVQSCLTGDEQVYRRWERELSRRAEAGELGAAPKLAAWYTDQVLEEMNSFWGAINDAKHAWEIGRLRDRTRWNIQVGEHLGEALTDEVWARIEPAFHTEQRFGRYGALLTEQLHVRPKDEAVRRLDALAAANRGVHGMLGVSTAEDEARLAAAAAGKDVAELDYCSLVAAGAHADRSKRGRAGRDLVVAVARRLREQYGVSSPHVPRSSAKHKFADAVRDGTIPIYRISTVGSVRDALFEARNSDDIRAAQQKAVLMADSGLCALRRALHVAETTWGEAAAPLTAEGDVIAVLRAHVADLEALHARLHNPKDQLGRDWYKTLSWGEMAFAGHTFAITNVGLAMPA